MNINFSKTKELILGSMSRNPPTSIFIDGNEIQRVQVFKLLGVFIDNKFNWKSHVKAICSKAASRLYVLRLLKRSGISQSDLVCFYISVIRSILEYACPAWHNSLTAEQIGNIESVQKRAINIIYGYVDYYEKLAELDLPTLYCHQESICKSFFKSILNDRSCLHYLLPEQRNVEITGKLRHAASYEPPTVRTIKCQRSFINFALEHYQNC